MKINRTMVEQEFFPLLNPRVIDGDALEATIQLPFGACIIKRIRLKGFWAPEVTGRLSSAGLRASERLYEWIAVRELFIRCNHKRQDRYGRVIAELWSTEGPADPKEVLGDFQLTAEQHKLELDLIRRADGMFYPVSAEPFTGGEEDSVDEPAQ